MAGLMSDCSQQSFPESPASPLTAIFSSSFTTPKASPVPAYQTTVTLAALICFGAAGNTLCIYCKACSKIYSKILCKTYNKTCSKTCSKICSKIYSKIYSKILYKTYNKICSKLLRRIYSKICSKLLNRSCSKV